MSTLKTDTVLNEGPDCFPNTLILTLINALILVLTMALILSLTKALKIYLSNNLNCV